MKLSKIAVSTIVVPVILAASASIVLANADVYSRIKLYTHELKAKPKSVALLIKRGNLYFKTNEFDKAIADYNAALKLNDHADKAYYGLGLALARNGYIHEGIKDLSIYISRHPKDEYAYTKRGVRYLWLREDSKAKKDLTKAITLNPKDAEAHDDLGVVLGRGGNFKAAFKQFEACVTIDPTYFKGWHNLSMASYVLGNNQLALAAVNRALKLDPNHRSSMLLKAVILHAMGQDKEAAKVKEDAEWLPVGDSSENIPIN